jgi:hypothetical protein
VSYFRKALSGLQSQPMGGRVATAAMGDIAEWGTTAGTVRPTPPPPSAIMRYRGRVGPRWYRQLQGTTLGADEPDGNTLSVPTLPEPQGAVVERIDRNVTSLVAAEAEESKRRKISLVIAGVGLLFAAAKLGIIAIPHIRKMRSTPE